MPGLVFKTSVRRFASQVGSTPTSFRQSSEQRSKGIALDIEWARRHCLSFPKATEQVQWGDHLVFKVAGKIFAILSLEPGGYFLSCKCTPEEFSSLTEQPGIRPAPYLARAHWIALEAPDSLPAAEVRRLLRQAYDLVVARLPARLRTSLGNSLS